MTGMVRPGARDLVDLIAVVVVVDALPQAISFGTIDNTGPHAHSHAVDLDRDVIRMTADVVIPGGVMLSARLGGDDDEGFAVGRVEERSRPRLF